MLHYHIYIQFIDKKGKDRNMLFYDHSEETVKRIADLYMANKPFFLSGSVFPPSKINEICIYESDMKFDRLVLPSKEPILEAKNTYILSCFDLGRVKGVNHCTHDFITSAPLGKEKIQAKPPSKKEKVFIVHGRDDKQALLLQRYLDKKLKVDAVMFDDLPDKGRTIIEQLEYIENNVGYAFVIVTPDDLGCLREDMNKWITKLEGRETVSGNMVSKIFESLKTRTRQNVVFELGLFIGALGRKKVCYLLRQDVEEKPSDIDGILYKSFNKSVKEVFDEIADELKED